MGRGAKEQNKARKILRERAGIWNLWVLFPVLPLAFTSIYSSCLFVLLLLFLKKLTS
jgi:uncharacterized membrane protein